MTGPELSRVIPCHNDRKYPSETIEFVLKQEHELSSIEVIVVDDHGTDDETLEVLERWRQRVSSVHERRAWEYRAQDRSRRAAWAAVRALRYTPLQARPWNTLAGALLSP